jgi:parallel beta-helix repeat protein
MMNSKISTNAVFIFAIVACLSQVLIASVYLSSDNFNGTFDDAGYSDGINWGYSPNHPYPYEGGIHELLSGEWGVAIFYDGISTEPNSMWLPNSFIFPNWTTNSTFSTSLYGEYRDDSNNPVIGYDTGQSKIISGDGKVEITIDYEVVDLGDGNWSPLAITDVNGQIGFVKSDRYLFLQTYTVTANPQNEANITGLELYQLLHSHGADEYGPCVHASYTSANYNDTLADYAPYNSVHSIGNFRCDFTQWNNLDDPQASTPWEHVDWVGFSCAVEPDVYECGDYNSTALGNYGKPQQGVHIDVEKRSLNQSPYRYGETAGAMGWYLGTLAPGESNSITVAFMFGYGPIYYNSPILPPGCDVNLTNADDVSGCIEPNNFINYNICYSTTCDINDVNIIDTLPAYVDFNDANGGGVYEPNFHTVRWNLHNIEANDSNCFTLKVKVAENVIGGSALTNTVKMYSGGTIIKTATKNTQVCCMNPVVYVKWDANGSNNGSSWTNAYKELRDAIANVKAGNQGCANQIWVAAGVYKPTNDANQTSKTFEMLDHIDVYGHFAGWETSIDQRNLADANNDTILTGDIDDNNTSDVYKVVTAASARLDGFTVKKSKDYSGIFCSQSTATIANCIVKNNNSNGIHCTSSSNVTITNTFVNDNSGDGIFCDNEHTYITIDRCTIGPNNVGTAGLNISDSCAVNITDSIFSGNKYYGISATYSNLTIERCDISDSQYNSGVYCSSTIADIQRCTIQRNGSYGLFIDGSSSIVNAALNIISDNTSGGVYISGSGSNRLISNLIYRNTYYGINVYYSPAEIRNNTIVDNSQYGIYGNGDPNINSNIIWGNDVNGLYGTFTNTKINYNCIQNYSSGTNIKIDPCFVNEGVNNYHLKSSSQCIDRGDPNFTDVNGVDIDGEDRVMDGDSDGNSIVDMGADEFCPFDLSHDGFVNFLDFAVFAKSWGKSTGDTNYNYHCDFSHNGKIDYNDLEIFCAHWLWPSDWDGFSGEGAYFEESGVGGEGEMMMGEGEGESMMAMEDEQQEQMMAGEGGGESVMMQPEQQVILESAQLQVEQEQEINVDEIVEPVDVNEIINWLDDLWQNDDSIRGSMTEDEYLEFRMTIEESNQY